MKLRRPLLVVALALAVPTTAAAQVPHTVASGESLSSIAAADGLTVTQLAAENGVSSDSGLIAGATILIPPQSASAEVSDVGSAQTNTTGAGSDATATPASTSTSTSTSGSGGGYVVQPGDTLSAIAARSGLSISELAADNGLDPNGLLLAGRSLTLGGGGGAASSAEPVADTQTSEAGGPYPTATSLSPDTVGSIGAASGTSASLTEGVGYNESGFNNDEVSGTGAVGIMQIEPSTWSYINQTLTPGAPLDPNSATDNVRGGALYLQSLINQTGSVSDGVAAYNEGLGALRNFGIYPSTQQYVDNVLADQQRYASGG